MATGQTATDVREDVDDEVSDKTVDEHDAALRGVQWLLKDEGVDSFLVHTYLLRLRGPAKPPFWWGERARTAPELVVRDSDGTTIAVVVMGQRSGSYLVTVSGAQPRLHTVRRQHREQVVGHILAALPGQGTATP